ncbi:MAG: segregation/condensation protein A [Parasporobacterium sp.]|nr:segregation/condensation protein A [Parasporobacterium sp.]
MDRALSKVNSQAMLSGQIKREEISLTDKIDEISRMVRLTSKVSFQSLLGTQITRINIIVTFLAVLELMKTGEIIARQSSFGTDITLYPPEVLNDKKEPEISD